MRILFTFLLNLVTAPFRWLAGAAYKKYRAVGIQISYAPGRAHIASQYGSPEQELTHLVVAYLLFLSRYFFICDERQIRAVAQCLADYIGAPSPPGELAGVLLELVHSTLNQNEQTAVAGLFTFPNLPPLTYAEGNAAGRTLAQYTLTTYKTNDLWTIDFHMSVGPDIVLLPLTVGLLYHYVSDKIGKESQAVFNASILELLTAQKSSDCRSVREAVRISNAIIAKNFEA
jgi:hypothetical protein